MGGAGHERAIPCLVASLHGRRRIGRSLLVPPCRTCPLLSPVSQVPVHTTRKQEGRRGRGSPWTRALSTETLRTGVSAVSRRASARTAGCTREPSASLASHVASPLPPVSTLTAQLLTGLLHARRHVDGAATRTRYQHLQAAPLRSAHHLAPSRRHRRACAARRPTRCYLPNTWNRGCFLPSTPQVMSPCPEGAHLSPPHGGATAWPAGMRREMASGPPPDVCPRGSQGNPGARRTCSAGGGPCAPPSPGSHHRIVTGLPPLGPIPRLRHLPS